MMNNIQILGTITREPELKYTQSGSAILNFGIAYNDKWKNQSGEMQEKAHFFEVSVFGKQAETINQFFNKGSRILIDGSLDFQSWEKEGQKHSKVGIKLNRFTFVDKRDNNGQNQQQPQQQPQPVYQNQQNQQQQPQTVYQDNNGQQVSQNQYQQTQQGYQQPQQSELPSSNRN